MNASNGWGPWRLDASECCLHISVNAAHWIGERVAAVL